MVTEYTRYIVILLLNNVKNNNNLYNTIKSKSVNKLYAKSIIKKPHKNTCTCI